MSRMRVLVTGAAGLVGAEVVAGVLAAGCDVVALLHRGRDIVRNDGTRVSGRVTCLTGDVTAPDLGLGEPGRALAGQLDLIVHCAAITGFGYPDDVYQAVNVDGTAHVLALARRHGTPVVHIGTAYVCGQRDGLATEAELDVGQRFGNGYEASKLRAEALVRAAGAAGLPVAVVRPSVVTGTQRRGVIREFKDFYAVLKVVTEARVSCIPGRYDARIDLVPVDRVAAVTTQVVTRFPDAVGQTFHVVGHSLSMRDFSDVIAEFPNLYMPRVVTASTFDADQLPARERAYYRRVVGHYTSYFDRRIQFDATATNAFAGTPTGRDAKRYLRTVLGYAVAAGYLNPDPGRGRAGTRLASAHRPAALVTES